MDKLKCCPSIRDLLKQRRTKSARSFVFQDPRSKISEKWTETDTVHLYPGWLDSYQIWPISSVLVQNFGFEALKYQ